MDNRGASQMQRGRGGGAQRGRGNGGRGGGHQGSRGGGHGPRGNKGGGESAKIALIGAAVDLAQEAQGNADALAAQAAEGRRELLILRAENAEMALNVIPDDPKKNSEYIRGPNGSGPGSTDPPGGAPGGGENDGYAPGTGSENDPVLCRLEAMYRVPRRGWYFATDGGTFCFLAGVVFLVCMIGIIAYHRNTPDVLLGSQRVYDDMKVVVTVTRSLLNGLFDCPKCAADDYMRMFMRVGYATRNAIVGYVSSVLGAIEVTWDSSEFWTGDEMPVQLCDVWVLVAGPVLFTLATLPLALRKRRRMVCCRYNAKYVDEHFERSYHAEQGLRNGDYPEAGLTLLNPGRFKWLTGSRDFVVFNKPMLFADKIAADRRPMDQTAPVARKNPRMAEVFYYSGNRQVHQLLVSMSVLACTMGRYSDKNTVYASLLQFVTMQMRACVTFEDLAGPMVRDTTFLAMLLLQHSN